MEIKFTGSLIDGYVEKVKGADGIETGEVIKHEPTFEGYIKVKVPSFPERARFPKELGLESLSTAAEDADQKEKLKSNLNNMEVIAKASELMQKYITEVCLRHTKVQPAVELKTVDDLYCYPAAATIIVELASEFIRGFQPKN